MAQYIAKRFILSGRVQGVGCRAQVQEWVEMIGHLSGFVRNLPNGKVEVCLKGPDWRLTDIEEIFRNRMLKPVQIADLQVEEIDLAQSPLNDGFIIRRD
jgi:acylphosphatase